MIGIVHRTDWARDCFVLMISHEASMMLAINEQPKPSIVGELDIAEQLKPSTEGERHKSQGTLVLPTYHGSISSGSFLTGETVKKKTAICSHFSF